MCTETDKLLELQDGHIARLIVTGSWLYDNLIVMPVRIFALNYDFWFHLDEGYPEEGQQPELNSQGEQYVVVWHNESFFSAPDFPSNGFLGLAEAKSYAEHVVKKVQWDKPVTEDHV